jgi:TonB-linked SusC/RagA family outer membrane protein
MRSSPSNFVRWAASMAVALVATAVTAQAQSGRVTVRVTDAANQQPVGQAQVQIVGTTLGGLTGPEGRFTIRGVPVGTHQVRVLRVGYGEQKKPVEVAADQEATVDFAISAVAISLTPVVTTATGEQRRVELGNAVAQIDASKIAAEAPIRSVEDLINSRTAGVAVQSGTQTGTGAMVRIRGASSLNLSNEPIYVIDGIRMTSNNNSGFDTGGNNASRVGDLNPDEIENVEIVKGPSAATLYGTDAANGVIVITTKKGRAGAARWNVYGEGGYLEDRNTYPWNYTLTGKDAVTGGTRSAASCTLPIVSAGTCLVDSLRIYSPFMDTDATPIGTGDRYQVGGNLSTGTETVRFFLSGEREEETGVLELPPFEIRRLNAEKTPIREWVKRPNALDRNSVRMNVNGTVGSKLDLGVNTGYINLNQRYTRESNATSGLGSQVFGGQGFKENGTVATTGTPLNGYRAWTPAYSWQEKTGQGVNRFIGSANATYRPFTWNQTRLTFGTDLTDRVDDNLLYRGEGPPITTTYRLGFKDNARTNIRNTTFDLTTGASFNPTTWLNSRTTLGAQYVNYKFDQGQCGGEELPPGAQTCGDLINPNNQDESTTLTKTLGFFLEQSVALRDRLFLTAAVRTDQNSAFGTDFQSVWYPKLSASWVISDEEFFPQVGWLNSLRFRTAFGAAGVQPGSNDALRTISANAVNIKGADTPVLTNNDLGNIDLKPERTTELEGGFEMKLLNNRLSVDLTGYQKRTKDALISAIIPPSAGTGATNVRRNLGAVRNRGLEVLTNAQIVDKRAFAFDLTLNGSMNSNELLDLGGTPPQIGTSTRVMEGWPLFGWWARPITGFADKNGDGILTSTGCGPYSQNDTPQCEVTVGDSSIFRGYTQPRRLLTMTPGFEFLNRKLRVQALLDYRGGFKAYNNTERIRCVSRQNCNGLMNPNSSLEEQAMVVATLNHPSRTLDGFFQDGEFLKLREASVRWSLPSRVATLMKARNADMIFSGRNLGTWSNYRGIDPENNFQVSASSDTGSDFQTIGLASYWTLRFNLGF